MNIGGTRNPSSLDIDFSFMYVVREVDKKYSNKMRISALPSFNSCSDKEKKYFKSLPFFQGKFNLPGASDSAMDCLSRTYKPVRFAEGDI